MSRWRSALAVTVSRCSFSKMWGSMAAKCVTPHRYHGGTEKRPFRRIFLTCVTTVFPFTYRKRWKWSIHSLTMFGILVCNQGDVQATHVCTGHYSSWSDLPDIRREVHTVSVGLQSWRVWLNRGRQYLLRVLQRTRNSRLEFGNRLPRFRRKNYGM